MLEKLAAGIASGDISPRSFGNRFRINAKQQRLLPISITIAVLSTSIFSQELSEDKSYDTLSKSQMIPPVSASMRSDSITKEFKVLGDINGDGKPDTVFLKPEFCPDKGEDGFSFVFSDTTIPRIRTCVGCRSLDWIFAVEDLDEDGKIELGQYSSSCASRTKSLLVLKLVNSKWKILGKAIYDVNFPEPDFSKCVKKIKKGIFTIRETYFDDKGKKITRNIQFKIH